MQDFYAGSYSKSIPYQSAKESINPSQFDTSAAYSHFLTEEEHFKERADELLKHFVGQYDEFAQKVLAEMRQALPDQVKTAELILNAAHGELNTLLSNLWVKSDQDITRMDALIRGVSIYMGAAEYLEDKEAMLAYAVEELKSMSEVLGLVKISPQQDTWLTSANQRVEASSASKERLNTWMSQITSLTSAHGSEVSYRFTISEAVEAETDMYGELEAA